MGKLSVIVSFIAAFVVAIYVFINKESKSIKESLKEKEQRDPLVVLEDFTFYYHSDHALEAKLSARLGHLFEPNIVELYGDVRGTRYKDNETETMTAELAQGYFKAHGISQMLSNSELEKAELREFVEIGFKKHVLMTDYAEFLNDEQIIRSDRPVRVEGPGRWMNGEEGFVYNIKKEDYDIFGAIKGATKLEPDPEEIEGSGELKEDL